MSGTVRIKEELSWRMAADYLMLILGALIQALAMRLFLIPAMLLSGGVSGAAQIVNSFTDWPIGLMVFIGNLPLFFLGWRYLGGARFAIRTGVAITVFSILTDILVYVMPAEGLTHDLVLSSIFGGVMFGAGLGLVYRAKGTSGGSDILGQILYHRKGVPMTQAYFATDTIVLLAGGLAWSWELALYGMIVMYVSGLAAELVLEGPSILRTVMIISACHQQVAKEIMTVLERGVTILEGSGAYTGKEHPVLFCVVTRSEVNKIKALVYEKDSDAFIVIGDAHEALGEGFKRLIPPEA
ncbi:MAG: YitT family protein [Anaerolineaceae bacterium]|nr:YitT family protein [Anaerolineaceae bacterium]